MYIHRATPLLRAALSAAVGLLASAAFAADAEQTPPPPVQVSPLAAVANGRTAKGNNQILTTGIRSTRLPSNHALIVTVSEYPRSPLPGVLTDRKLGIELAERLGVPAKNIVELSEQQVTREGLTQALQSMSLLVLPAAKIFVYYSGPRARFYNTR